MAVRYPRSITAHEWWLLARGIAIGLLDSERTDQIHVAEEITGRPRYAAVLDRWREREDLRTLLADRPELRSDRVDFAALRALPAETLGNRYVRHLDDNGITADAQAAPTTHVADPDMAYLMRRFRQTHDVWHALLDLGIAGHEEVIIHAFSWGQLRLPVSAMVIGFGTLKHIIGEGRWGALRRALGEAHRIGREADDLLPVFWERMWAEPIAAVRTRYHLRPCTRAYVDG